MFPLGVDVGRSTVAAGVWRDGRAELALRTDRRGIRDVALSLLGSDTPTLIDGAPHHPADLVADLLRGVLDAAPPPARTALTHPDDWAGHRRDALRDAAGRAGIADVLLVPAACASALHLAGPLPPGELAVVCHVGGSTATAAVVRGTGGIPEPAGPPTGIAAGGRDLDHALHLYVETVAGADGSPSPGPETRAARLALRRLVTAAREELTSGARGVVLPVRLPGISRDVEVTPADLAAAARPLLDALTEALAGVLDPAGTAPVFLTGGASRLPALAETLAAALGRTVVPCPVEDTQSAALGAARAAHLDSAGSGPGPVWTMPPPFDPPPVLPDPAVVDREASGWTAEAGGGVVVVRTDTDPGGTRGRWPALAVVCAVIAVLAVVLAVALGR
ncbi:Hsp70 family protein [Actinoplanes sp. NPDC049265]|uniref:Hsp70 family protein n=1 Tax=Actinoplanes sp. NPDC049265 TaxID=3363902 RepID=UPI00371AE3E1